jgi:LytS/YehU family sensor histidine kinase
MIASATLTCFTILLLFELHIIDYPNFVKAELIPKRMYIAMYLCVGLVLFFAGRFVYLFFNTFQLSNEKVKNELDSYNNEINSLRLQINPNFLFNSLETLKKLLEENRLEEALKFNTETYALLNKQIKYAQKESIRLEEDIQWIENYLKTQQIAEGKLFDYQILLSDPELNLQEIPPILLQPILEKYISAFKTIKSKHKIIIQVNDFNSTYGQGIIIKLTDRYEVTNILQNQVFTSILNLEKRIELINKTGRFNISLEKEDNSYSKTYTLKIIEYNG